MVLSPPARFFESPDEVGVDSGAGVVDSMVSVT
jgi:hypothetical protein